MATTALLTGASPLKLKQGTLLGTFRPHPSKPVKLSTAAFSYQRCSFAPIIFKNPKPPQYYSLLAQKTTHYLTADSKSLDHTPLSSTQCLNVSQDNRPPAANPNIISKLWDKSLEALRKPATAAVVLGLLVMYNPANSAAALAAPAGRFGGTLLSYSVTSHDNSSGHSLTTIYNNPGVRIYEPIVAYGGMPVLLYLFGLIVGFVLVVQLRIPRSLNPGLWILWILWTVLMANRLYSIGQTSVVKLQLQVNSSIMGRAAQTDLNMISKNVRAHCTYTLGLRYLLRDTAVALLRQPDHCISGFSSVVTPNFTRAGALHCFEYLVVKEKARDRYDEETVVNEDNTEPQSTTSQKSITDESHNDDVMVTILLAADGEYSKWLTITDSSDVRRVLERLASMDPTKLVFGLEVVWTTPHHLSSNAASKSID